MDPVTQTNAANVSDANTTNTNPTPANTTNTVIAGAFGGTLPVPPQVSDTMPAFSFDEDDFWNTTPTSTPPVPAHEAIVDPFAGWVESLQQTQTTPTVESVVVNAIPTTEDIQEPTIPEWTISLDSLEESTDTTIPQDMTYEENKQSDRTNESQPTVAETMIDEVASTIPDSTSNGADNTSPIKTEEATANDISFDLPSTTSEDAQTNTTTNTEDFVTPSTPEEVQTNTVQESSFDLPTQEVVSNDISFDLPSTTSEDIQTNTTTNAEDFVIPSTPEGQTSQEETTSITSNISETTTENTDNNEATTETVVSSEESQNTDDSIPAQSITESRDDTTHDLQETFEDFKKAFDTYSTFKNSASLTLTGLRTEEEEINYTFNQENNNTISISKSNTSDILSFEQTESWVKVMINTDLIWYYGVDQVDADTTHYLKEKLGKFTMMLTSEYEREEKRVREWLRKIKDTLKNF